MELCEYIKWRFPDMYQSLIQIEGVDDFPASFPDLFYVSDISERERFVPYDVVCEIREERIGLRQETDGDMYKSKS